MDHSPLKYATVCSGIEAPSSAWHSLGWQPVWFSEIEPFPCKVLKHHYPQVPNLGDMTKLNEHEIYRESTIDLFCGGTPCQSFSIAGLRGGLDDGRGKLALEYCRILIAKRPRWFLWENVPGVFSSNGGKDFACILSAFTGKEINAECLGNAGVIEGEFYSVAWRVLDAQYFGVPQRRRRVFVVGYLGKDWRPPFAVLFERDSLRRDFEASAKERKGTTGKAEGDTNPASWPKTIAPTLDKTFASHWGQNNQHIDNGAGLFVQTSYGLDEARNGHVENSGTLRSHKSGGSEHVVAVDNQEIVFGVDFQQKGMVNENSEQLSTTICGNDHAGFGPGIIAFGAQNSHMQGLSDSETTSPTLDKSKTPAVVYDTTQITSPQNGSNPQPELCYSLAKGQHVPLVTLPEVVACEQADTLTIGANQTTGRPGDIAAINAINAIARRLTPLEFERLQGFPDNHTAIPGAKDGPRYAAIGNSMAVPVMKWIGERIAMMDKIMRELKAATP